MDDTPDAIRPLQQTLNEVTEDQVKAALRLNKGSVDGAAQSLQVNRATVYRMIRKYGIEIERVVIERMGT